jgi:ParB family chromosome partitioning protein
MRLAKSAWLPEILTDREVPSIRALGVMNDPDDEADEDDLANPQKVEADEAGSPGPAPATGAAEADDNLPAWPFPTSASVTTAETVQHTA